MRSLLLVALALTGCTESFAPELPPPDGVLSAARAPGESYDDIVASHGAALKSDTGTSAYDSAVRLADLDPSALPEWSADDLAAGFTLVRDTRFLDQGDGFVRRPSFLYPEDGCFARAEAMDFELERAGYARPGNVFSFGNLSVATRNTPWGGVSWWYHVAPAVRVGDTVYVLDPSIEPRQPIALASWLARQQTNGEPVSVSACSPFAFQPSYACDQTPFDESARSVVYTQSYYLGLEWNRQIELGRDPYEALGDRPPW